MCPTRNRVGTSFSFTEGEWKGRRRIFRTDRIIVKVKAVQNASDADIADTAKAILNRIGGRLVRRRPGDTLFVAEVPDGDIPAIAENLMGSTVRSDVDFAEPDLMVRSSGPLTPKDYYYNNEKSAVYAGTTLVSMRVRQQWGPQQIKAADAWELLIKEFNELDHEEQPVDSEGEPLKGEDVRVGSDEVLIAVVDSGLSMDEGGEFDHPELKGDRFQKGNDYVDVAEEEHFALKDEHYHGTHMTGVIAASTDNALVDAEAGTTSKDLGGDWKEGIAGLNWTSPVVIHRVLDAGNGFDQQTGANGGIADVYDAVMDVKEDVNAATNPIKCAVINLSLGFDANNGTATTDDDTPKTLEFMCREIMGLPIILCCATGNNGATDRVEYPAHYANEFPDNVISVGATEKNGDEFMWNESNYDGDAHRVTVVAPGVNITSTTPTYEAGTSQLMYYYFSGTSQATAHVTGVASLVWSRNPKLTSGQVIEILKNTAVPLGSGDLPNSQWGHGRIDAGAAVSCAQIEVRADEASITLANVEMQITEEEEVVLLIRSCASIKFTVTTTGYDFGVSPGERTYVPSSDSAPEDFERFLVGVASYTGNSADPTAYGTVSILPEGEVDPIVIYITASTIGASNALISLALDKSGSMGDPSGVGDLARMDVLKRAAEIMVEALRVNDAMGVICFSADADELVSVKTVASKDSDPGKAALISGIGTLGDDGLTAIGDGLEAADGQVDAALAGASYTHKAIVVLTDGHETTGKYIDEVTVSHPVYAVAMGIETEVDTDKLYRLAGHSEGFLLMSGELDDFGVYRIAKYFLQILVSVSNEDIVRDPQGRILPEQEHVVPFDLTSADTRSDVFLLMPGMPGDDRDQLRGILELRLITPDGRVIDPGDADGDRTIYRHGAFVSYYRLELPHRGEHAGLWRALVTLDGQRFKQYLDWREGHGDDIGPLRAHGVPYMLLMHARSSLRLESTLEQRGFVPGAPVTLRARVLENGRPLVGLATVKVRLSHPDGSESEFKAREVDPGIYEETRVATMAGTYSWRIIAEGRTRGGQWFTRERVATSSVWV